MRTKSFTFENNEGTSVRDGKELYHSVLEVELSQVDAYRLALQLLNKIKLQSGIVGERKVGFLLTGRMTANEDGPELDTHTGAVKDVLPDDLYGALISGRITAE